VLRAPIPTGRAWIIYPLVLIAAASLLTVMRFSGTSVGSIRVAQVRAQHVQDPSLVAGTPRPIRSDEWNVSTPLVIAQSHHGFPRYTADGLGRHDLAVVLDIPNRDWSTAFKPYNLPFLVLDVEHAFAARWWLLALLILLPAYGLMLLLTGRMALAILFSLALYLSPFIHWWYLVITLATVGLGLFALACFLAAQYRASRIWRMVFLAGSAYGLVGFALVFYPPFQVPVALVLAAVGVGWVIAQRSEGRSPSLGGVAGDLAAVGLASGVVLALFYLSHKSTIAAITGTVYPGRRRITGGHGSLLQLFSAPFDLAVASHGATLSPASNESELSSFVMLAPFVLLQLFRLRLRDLASRHLIPLVAAGAAFATLLVWYFISLPGVIAKVLFLDRVPPSRAVVGIGLADLLVVFFFLSTRPNGPAAAAAAAAAGTRTGTGTGDSVVEPRTVARERLWRERTGAITCAALALAFSIWIGNQLATSFPGLQLTRHQLLFISGCFALTVLLILLRKALAGGVMLVALSAVLSLGVNPVYRGLGDLTSSPLVTTAVSLDASSHRTWLSFAGDGNTELVASGVRTINAVSFYPDAKAWRLLDPAGAQSEAWNRYANVVFAPRADAGPPTISLVQLDVVKVEVYPCDRVLDAFDVGFIVSRAPLTLPCLSPAAELTHHGTPLYVYRR